MTKYNLILSVSLTLPYLNLEESDKPGLPHVPPNSGASKL